MSLSVQSSNKMLSRQQSKRISRSEVPGQSPSTQCTPRMPNEVSTRTGSVMVDEALAPSIRRHAGKHARPIRSSRAQWWARIFAGRDKELPGLLLALPLHVIHPTSIFATIWNIATVLFVSLCAIFVPFQVCFDYDIAWGQTTERNLWLVVVALMETFFVVDLGVNANMAYYDDDELVDDRPSIMRNYVYGWLLIDFITVLSGLVGLLSTGMKEFALAQNLRLLRMMKLLKLLRLFKLSRALTTLDGVADEMRIVVRVFKIATWISCVTHIASCGFYMVSVESGAFWLQKEFGDECVDVGNGTAVDNGLRCWRTHSLFDRYVASLYWGFVTVTTVGYGDIEVKSTSERIYAMIVCFFGTALFAYMVGEITALASRRGACKLAYEERMSAVEEFMRHYKFPKPLRISIRGYYKACWEREIYFNESDILGELSLDLRREVSIFLKKNMLRKVPFLRLGSELLIERLVRVIQPRFARAGEVILRLGDKADEMFLLDKGEVEIWVPRCLDATREASADDRTPKGTAQGSHVSGARRRKNSDDMVLRARLAEGAFFGEVALLDPTPRTCTVVAVRPCELFTLSRTHFDNVMSEFPSFQLVMRKTATARLQRDSHAIVLGEQADSFVQASFSSSMASNAVAPLPTDTDFPFPQHARANRRPTLSAMRLEDTEAKDESTLRDLVRRASLPDRFSPPVASHNAVTGTESSHTSKAVSGMDANDMLSSSAAMQRLEAHISDRVKAAEERIINRVVAALTQKAPGSLHQIHES